MKFVVHPEGSSPKEPVIEFHYEDIVINGFNEEEERAWITRCIKEEGKLPGALQVIFCRDEYLLEINKKYLDHHDYTDVITFDYTDHGSREPGSPVQSGNEISGDIFISQERVQDNARALDEDPGKELRRVLIHGVLHLLGYTDQNPEAQAEMRRKENYCLSLRKQI